MEILIKWSQIYSVKSVAGIVFENAYLNDFSVGFIYTDVCVAADVAFR